MAAEESGCTLTRKTRIVCISDTHNSSPKDGAWKLPQGDVLIHAGDFTNQGTFSEIQKFVQWIENVGFEAKIVIAGMFTLSFYSALLTFLATSAGNHDVTLDQHFYAEHGQKFHNQHTQDATACHALLTNSSSIIYLNHSSAHVRLTSLSGPRTQFNVFGSPHIPSRGLWAFGCDNEADAERMWKEIPQETDVVVTHTPPKGFCDNSPKWGDEAGCPKLRNALGKIRPCMAICGHVHEGRGVVRVRWNGINGETAQQQQVDNLVGNKKQCLVDLTGKTHAKLDNVGWHGARSAPWVATPDVCEKITSSTTSATAERRGVTSEIPFLPTCQSMASTRKSSQDGDPSSGQDSRARSEAGPGVVYPAGKSETCIVNAAILATSYGVKPKRFNKPIVIDIELPVTGDDDGY